jgi:hypothetical protein
MLEAVSSAGEISRHTLEMTVFKGMPLAKAICLQSSNSGD